MRRRCRSVVSIGIAVNGSASPVLGNGLADVYGGLLEGSSGVPGTPYQLTFGAGNG